MSVNLIGFLSFVFVGFTILARIMEGAFANAGDFAILQNLTVFRSMDILGVFSVPVPNFSFFTSGLPHLITFDYPFFGGMGSFFQYLLYSASVAVAFGCIMALTYALFSYFTRKT